MSEHQLLVSLLSLSVMLVIGRGTAELARRCNQPEVLGELIGGFILGPSVFGVLFSSVRQFLFGDSGVTLSLFLFSWVGAILLLMLAGAEVDLNVLSTYLRPGFSCALFVIIPSIIVGTIFGSAYLHQPIISSLFLGSVLSVTAVGVVAKIFIEQGVFRRSYAQVIMAAGIASEIIVWPIISGLSSVKDGGSWVSGLVTALYASAFFSVMLTVGQKCMDWSMRRIADSTQISHGQLTLIIVVGMFFACVTQILGLHALLGPFAVGLLIARAPRTKSHIKEDLHAITMGVFAPIFFVSAGMRIDATRILSPDSLIAIVALFAAASLTKVILGWLGGLIGGMRPLESLLIGLGTNMKGGTDVVVAILGVTLGLLPDKIYSMYAIVAVLTVFISPILITAISKKVLPLEKETARLTKEAAARRAYFATVEKILFPSYRPLRPVDCVPLLKLLAIAKDNQHEVFDILELELDPTHSDVLAEAATVLRDETDTARVEYLKTTADAEPNEAIVSSSQQCDLVIMGALRQDSANLLTLGKAQDKIISQVNRDILVVIDGGKLLKNRMRRILVPVNGLEHSMAAADIGAYIAEASDAELVFLTVVHHEEKLEVGKLTHHRINRAGAKILKEVKFRTSRLKTRYRDLIKIGADVNAEILGELNTREYDLVVLGAVDRTSDSGIYLGKCIQIILTETKVPACILIHRSSQSLEALSAPESEDKLQPSAPGHQ